MTDVPALSRRTALVGAGLLGVTATLAACSSSSSSSSSSTSAAAADTASAQASAATTTAAGAATTGASAAGTALGPTSDIPVGGGKIYKSEKVVVTQPTSGTYKGFSAVCTHQGCTVASVTSGEIVCNCHGSHFSATDGSVLTGPAQTALGSEAITVSGGQVYLT